MRRDFIIVRGLLPPDERYDTLPEVARRIHALRQDRGIKLDCCQLASVGLKPEGHCIAVNLGEEIAGGKLLGYVFFPETLAYAWPRDREALSAALLAIVPDPYRQVDADLVDLDRERERRMAK